MDIVFLRELRIDTIIGLYDWERRVRQTLVLDLELAADITAVAATDDLSQGLDYAAIAARVCEFVQRGEYRLLETLAQETAAMLQADYAISWLRLRVAKPGAVAAARDVGVLIERGLREA